MQKKQSQQLQLATSIAENTLKHAGKVPIKQKKDFSFVKTADSIPFLASEHMLKNMLDRGVLTTIFGEGGCRKSHWTMYAAAIVSTGGTWFNGQKQEKAHVLIINVEDTEETIIKRLRANGADLAYCHIIREIPVNNPGSSQQVGEAQFELPRDLELLNDMIGEFNAQLVILDSARQIFSNYQHDITCKKIMGPLAAMAQNNYCSILLVNHRNGRTTRVSEDSVSAHNLLDSMAGSKLISSMSRVVLYFYKDQNHHEFSVIRGAKSNIGRDDFKPVRYTLHETALRDVHVVFPSDDDVQNAQNMQMVSIAEIKRKQEDLNRGKLVDFLVSQDANRTTIIQRFRGDIDQLKLRMYIQEYLASGEFIELKNGEIALSDAVLTELATLGYQPAKQRLGWP
jgi:hypothetical protein